MGKTVYGVVVNLLKDLPLYPALLCAYTIETYHSIISLLG